MFEPFQKLSDGFQKMGKDGLEAAALSYGEVNKGLQDIAAKFTDYSKKSFEDASRAFEQLMGAKSVQQAIEIQSQYAQKAYDTYITEASKLGEMYVAMARDSYRPIQQVTTRTRKTA